MQVDKIEAIDEEEEWPSLDLNLEVKEESENLGEESVVEEIEVSDEEEEAECGPESRGEGRVREFGRGKCG